MPTICVHILNEEAILAEIDQLPVSNDTLITIKNPRRKDGKDVLFIDANVVTVIYPLTRINFIEVMPTGEGEEIIGHFRE
jgi:hypothetical protein